MGGCLAVGIVLGVGFQTDGAPLLSIGADVGEEAIGRGVGPVEEALRYVEAKYVDPVEREVLVDGAINSLLGQLDPHSSYVPATDLGEHRGRLNGTSRGLGVNVLLVRDSVTVVDAIPGGPAAEAGLRPYDRIVSIGDTLVSGRGYSLAQVRARLRAAPAGAVRLEVVRPGVERLLPVTVVPREVDLPTVDEGFLLAPGVAYVRVRQFGNDTYEEFMRQLERLTQDSAARHLVLDLRGNSGGYLGEATKLLSQLFPDEGRLLVYTEGAHSPRKDYTSTGRVFFPVDRVAVVIDEGTASASEIVAGALQDWDRGVVVGARSYGKGLVQELFPLREGGALHVTVSRYFTPSGRSIQRPYVSYFEGGTRTESELIAEAADLAYVTAGGREVFGGGGIAPDVEVEAPRAHATAALHGAGDIAQAYAFEALERMAAPAALASAPAAVGELLPGLRRALADSGLAYSEADWQHYRGFFEAELARALTARREGPDAARRARARRDPFVAAALRAIRDYPL